MSERPGFGLKRGFNVDDLRGKPIYFYLDGDHIYGVLIEVTHSDLIVVDRPTIRIGKRGLETYVENRPTLFPINRISLPRQSSSEELDAVRSNLITFEEYLNEPVTVRNGGINHFGVLHSINSQTSVGLLPFLVPKFGLYGEYLGWSRKIPQCVSSVIGITPTSMKNLQRLVDSSIYEYNIAARKARLGEEKLKQEELQFKNKQ